MKKIGLLCLALVLALGAMGAGLAYWHDDLVITGTVATGEVLVGFVDQLTDDNGVVENELKDADDDGSDPLATEVCPEVCTNCPNIGKDVAFTGCELFEQKSHCCSELAFHDGLPCFDKILVTMTNVYPLYNPTLWMDIANCGTVPVNITGAMIVKINGEPLAVPIELPKCTMVQVDLDGDGVNDIGIGFSAPLDPVTGFPIEPQQIDPCEVAQYDLHFCIMDGCPQCVTGLTFEIEILAVQWNAP